jgi:hypothetical protein
MAAKAEVARRVRRLALGNSGDVKACWRRRQRASYPLWRRIPGLLRAARESPDTAYLDSPEALLAYLDGAFADVTPARSPIRWAWSPALAACLNSPKKLD